MKEGKRGQLIILFGLSGLNRRAKTGNLPLWLIYKCFRVTTQISYKDLQEIYKLKNSKYGEKKYFQSHKYSWVMLPNNPIFMFATNQMPDKPTHKRTEDGAVMIVMRMIIRI